MYRLQLASATIFQIKIFIWIKCHFGPKILVPSSRMNHSGMHIAKQTVHIEVEMTIGFHFEVFRIVNLVPQTALYRSTV